MLEAVDVLRVAGSRVLLDHVSLKLQVSDRLGLTGPTGSGKSLLLRALSMLDPNDSGEVLWREKQVAGCDVPGFRRQVVYLHQRPVLFEGTVEDNLRRPFELHSYHGQSFSREAVLPLLKRVQRDAAFLNCSAHQLSGGETQIVALIRAIQLKPSVLLLDEPTSGLDEDSTSRIERLILDWQEESPSERAFVCVSHDRDQISRLTNRTAAMAGGILTERNPSNDRPT